MTELRVVSLQIRDVLGLREFAVSPGRITQLRGKNASGKTSALRALEATLIGGNLAKLARVVEKGGEPVEPEVVLVLEGPGTEAYRVERKGDKVRVRARVGETAAFEDVGKPQAWLTSLIDPRGANPVTFLTAKDDQRALLLLEALPLKHDRAALLQQMGVSAKELPPLMEGLHPLEELGFIREAFFTKRTGVNRDEKAAAAAADQLRRNIPAVPPEDPAETIEFLTGEVESLSKGLAAAEERAAATEREVVEKAERDSREDGDRIEADFKATAAAMRAETEREAARMRAEVEKQIAQGKARVEAAIAEQKEAAEARLRDLDAKAAAARRIAAATRAETEKAFISTRDEISAKRQQLATLREQAKVAASVRALSAQADDFEKKREAIKAEADRLTAALEALDAYRRRLAEELPIEGLEIEGRAVRVNGIPFDQLNTAQRVDLAVRVACLRAKGQRLPLVFVDGAEALDRDHFEVLVERLRAAGVQSFIARVEDTELQVVTDEAVTA